MATYVGIELDEISVRAAVVRAQLGRVQVQRYVEIGLPAGSSARAEGSSDASEAASESAVESPARLAIADIVKLAGSGAELVVAIGADAVSLRRIELPAAAAKKVDELLPFEIESLVPFEVEAAILDHQPIESVDASKLELLVCAAPKAKVGGCLEQWRALGVDPMALVPSAPALAGLSMFAPELVSGESARMLVHVLADRTDVCFVRRGRAELARTITAGHRSVEAIGYGAPPPGSEAERLVRELRQTVASYRLAGGREPEALRIAGLLDPGELIVRWIGAALGRDDATVLALPEVVASKTLEPTTPPSVKARFAGPLALVGHVLSKPRHIDLRKQEFVRTRQLGIVRELGPLVAGSALAIFMAWGFSVYAQYSVLRARRQMLEAELARMTRAHLGQETTSVAEARRLLEEGRANPDPMPAWTAFDALLAVTAAIPESIRHDVQRFQVDLALDRSEGHFELQGVVGSIEESDRIRAALAEIPCFQNLAQAGATTPAADGRRQYRLEADVRCPDERRASDDGRRGRRARGGGSRASKQGGR